jgi:hypothetical protein
MTIMLDDEKEMVESLIDSLRSADIVPIDIWGRDVLSSPTRAKKQETGTRVMIVMYHDGRNDPVPFRVTRYDGMRMIAQNPREYRHGR